MKDIKPATGAVRAALVTLSAFLLALTVSASPAQARTALVELRIEGPELTMEPGTWYVTGTERVKRAGPGDNCTPRAGATRFAGPTALGIVATAGKHRKKLRPARYRTTDFGPQLCQIGQLRSFGHYPNPSGGFLYAVDYVSGFSSPDLADLSNGQSVLWYYGIFPSDPPLPGEPEANTGLPLELTGVPPRDADGRFVVRVVAHELDGSAQPATGATIRGARSVDELGGGRYRVTVRSGNTTLFADRRPDVRSNRLKVCVADRLASCPKAHGRRIVGSAHRDRLEGTAGFDTIATRGGADVVDLRAGGRDEVRCGTGRDAVLLRRGDTDDRLRGCERIRAG